MVLLMDIGNTRLKWGVLESDGSIQPGQPIVVSDGFLDELNSTWADQFVPERILVSSVASAEIENDVAQWSREMGLVKIDFVHSQAEAFGVRNAYEQPEKLGVDRWLSLIAMASRKQLPACVVDCGTALTLDVLDQQGQHLGGLIVPGLGLMHESLVRRTSGIRNSTEIPGGLLGSNTDSAIQSGIIHAACGLVERVFGQLRDEMGKDLKLYITGGDASRVAREVSFESVLAPALVLEGLAAIARETE